MIRLKEALEYARCEGKKINRREIAQRIWEDSSPRSAYMNFLNLEKGKTEKISNKAVEVICEEFDISADYLFGRDENPNKQKRLEEVSETITDLAETIKETAKFIQ